MSKSAALFMDYQSNVIAEWIANNPGKNEEDAVEALFPDLDEAIAEHAIVERVHGKTGVNRSDVSAVLAASAHAELCRAIKEYTEIYWGEGDGIEPLPQCVTNARAALSKARGES